MEDPDVNEMLRALQKRAELRGKIKAVDLEMKRLEIPIRKQSPRKPELRDEATLDLQVEKLGYEVELEQVEAQVEYLNFYLSVWKYTNYNNRV